MMTQTNPSKTELSPEDAERFAAAFRPSWELDEPSVSSPALAQTLPLGANGLRRHVPARGHHTAKQLR